MILSWLVGCCMCKRDEEMVDHLLMHCTLAREMWDFVFALFGIYWVMPRRVIDLLACWQGGFGHHQCVAI